MLVKQLNNLFHPVVNMTGDLLGRPLRDLRISVTDRCNFRCDYCMPVEKYGHNHKFLPKNKILSFEEIIMIISSMIPLGLKKVRITGGEPLLRKDISKLISMIRKLDNNLDIALTTNGTLLSKHAIKLFDAGLNRVTISIDAIEEDIFKLMSNSNVTPSMIISGIQEAVRVGLEVKANTVILKGSNESQIIPLTELFYRLNVPLRFIEYMDVGGTNNWDIEQVITGQDIRKIITKKYGILNRVKPQYFGEVSRNWSMSNGYEIGFIESVTNPFCSSCTRARISANGNLYTCLFSETGNNLKSLIDLGANEHELGEAIKLIWQSRNDKYSEERGSIEKKLNPIEMHFIGG